ncbi:hypothetical protein [Methylomusa anaerophila]|uniref:hypothetical protein n=1 Tax=Methylomusa anaerophila TaxID=1930071 RepID=UPI0011AEB38A|nr:hypothetical protein [Methylomusa anaerophila]
MVVLAVMVQFIFLNNTPNPNLTEAKVNQNPAAGKNPKPEEIQAFRFLRTRMQSPHGVIRYLVDAKSPAAFGVSESMGQAMEYTALLGDAKLFGKYAAFTDKYFKDPTGYYYWKIDVASKKGETTSALVDDLRIVKAYFIANEKKLGNYDKQIEKLAEAIYEFDVDAKGYPCDFYDGIAKKKADIVSLFYLDVETMEKLSKVNAKWSASHKNAIRILLNMPENQHGFYPQTFKIDTKQYIWPISINMVENLYTAIDAYNAGKSTSALVTFLKAQVKQGKVYNHYNSDGTPVNQDESTAVYALSTRFLALNNEWEAAEWCYHRTLDFQINDKKSFEGGFGEPETGLVYAFDQLEALLMLRMVEIKNDSQ